MKHLLSINKLLGTLAEVQGVTISSADCTAKQYKQFIKDGELYSSMASFFMNERVNNLYLGLPSKLPFSTGNLNNVKKS